MLKFTVESISGTADNSIQEFLSAISSAANSLVKHLFADKLLAESYIYAYVEAVTGSMESGDVVFSVYSSEKELSGFYQAKFNLLKSANSYEFSFDNYEKVNKSIKFIKSEIVAADNKVVFVKTESDENEIKTNILESVNDNTSIITSKIILEEDAVSKFESNGYIKSRIEAVDIGSLTSNNNRYSESFVKNLDKAILEFVKNGRELPEKYKVGSPWPTFVMFASHKPAKEEESEDRFYSIAAKITGTFRRGNIWGVTFETLKTTAGKDMAVLLLDKIVSNVSIRSHVEEATENEEGGLDITSGYIEGFGVDFTYRPAMKNINKNGIVFESNGGEMFKDLDDLKANNMDLYNEIKKRLDAGESQEKLLTEVNSRLESENSSLKNDIEKARIVIASGVCNSVIKKFETILDSEDAITPAIRKSIIETISPLISGEANSILSERKSLSPDTLDFSDLLTSRAQKIFNSQVESVKMIIAESIKKETFTAAPTTEGTESAPEGNEGLKNFNINSLDPRLNRIEMENEMVGLPRRQSGSSGNAVIAPLRDVFLSAAFGMNMYETENGNTMHVGDKYYPGRRQLIEEVTSRYKDHACIRREGLPSLDDNALEADPNYKRIHDKINNRIALEAGEITSSYLLGTLNKDFRNGIIEAAFYMAKWLSFASTEAITSDQYEITEEVYRHYNDHSFGTITKASGSWGAYSVGSGAVASPHKAWVKLTSATPTSGAITLTVTYTDAIGLASQTTTVIVPTGTVTGTYIEIRPAIVGQKFSDITSVSISNSDGANGDVFALVTEKPASTATELVASGRATMFTTKTVKTVDELDLEFVLGWRAMEDAMKNWAANGPGGLNLLGRMIANLAKDFAEIIDRRGFTALNSTTNYNPLNALTHDVRASAIPNNYTDAEWKSLLLEKIVNMTEMIAEYGKANPNRIAINHTDKHKLLWMKGDLILRNINRSEAFYNGLEWGTISGCKVYDAALQVKNKMMFADNSYVRHIVYIAMELHGPFQYLGSQKANTYLARQRSSDSFAKNDTRGAITIYQ